MHDKLLFDNTFYSDFETEIATGRIGPARRFLQSMPKTRVIVSVVTIAEYYERFGRVAAAKLAVNHATIGLHLADALKCGEIQTRLAAKRLGENDAWLAAQAMRAGATIVTRDKRFKDVRGLSVATY